MEISQGKHISHLKCKNQTSRCKNTNQSSKTKLKTTKQLITQIAQISFFVSFAKS